MAPVEQKTGYDYRCSNSQRRLLGENAAANNSAANMEPRLSR